MEVREVRSLQGRKEGELMPWIIFLLFLYSCHPVPVPAEEQIIFQGEI